jgi:hypothetical protein
MTMLLVIAMIAAIVMLIARCGCLVYEVLLFLFSLLLLT